MIFLISYQYSIVSIKSGADGFYESTWMTKISDSIPENTYEFWYFFITYSFNPLAYILTFYIEVISMKFIDQFQNI